MLKRLILWVWNPAQNKALSHRFFCHYQCRVAMENDKLSTTMSYMHLHKPQLGLDWPLFLLRGSSGSYFRTLSHRFFCHYQCRVAMTWGPRILCGSSGKEPYFVRFFYNCHPTFDVNEVKALRIARRVWQRALFCGVLLHKSLLLWGSFTIATLHWMSAMMWGPVILRGSFGKEPYFVYGAFSQNSLIVWGYCIFSWTQEPYVVGFFCKEALFCGALCAIDIGN